jgi:4-amino-4-deoxy-L-arabinose transferase-like glycosyltransferase
MQVTSLSASSIVVSVLWVVAIDLAAWCVGRWIYDRVDPGPQRARLEGLSYALVIGLTALGAGSFLLALGHLLYPAVLIGVVLALAAVGAARIVRRVLQRQPFGPAAVEPLTVLAIALVLSFAPLALIPSIPHDSVVYHLALPEEYLRHHALVSYPYNLNANMPHYVEMLFAPAMAGGGVVAATLLSYQFSLLILLGFVSLAARLEMAATAGLLCLIYLASPAVRWHIPLTYIEPALGCVLLFALGLFLRWREEQRRPQLLACCWLVGWAMGCKYTIWYMAAGLPLGILLVMLAQRRPLRERARGLILPAAMVAAPVVPWLVRQWVVTGDPLFPNLYRLLHTPTWSPVLDLQTTRKFTFLPLVEQVGPIVTFLRKPWDLVENHAFYLLPEPFSPLLLLLFLLSLLLPGSYRGPRKYVMLAGAIGYFSWALMPVPSNEGRYLVAVVPLMSLCAGLALEPLRKRLWLWVAGQLAVCIGFFCWLNVPRPGWIGRDPAAFYRSANWVLPWTETLNQRLPAQAKLYFLFDNRTLGLARDRWVDSLYDAPASLEVIRHSDSAAAAARKLRELGFTHLVMCWRNAKAVYFRNVNISVHPQIHPQEAFERERRVMEELLKSQKHLFDVGDWNVYELVAEKTTGP